MKIPRTFLARDRAKGNVRVWQRWHDNKTGLRYSGCDAIGEDVPHAFKTRWLFQMAIRIVQNRRWVVFAVFC